MDNITFPSSKCIRTRINLSKNILFSIEYDYYQFIIIMLLIILLWVQRIPKHGINRMDEKMWKMCQSITIS